MTPTQLVSDSRRQNFESRRRRRCKLAIKRTIITNSKIFHELSYDSLLALMDHSVFELWKISWGLTFRPSESDQNFDQNCMDFLCIQYIADPQHIIWQYVRGVEKTVGGWTRYPPSNSNTDHIQSVSHLIVSIVMCNGQWYPLYCRLWQCCSLERQLITWPSPWFSLGQGYSFFLHCPNLRVRPKEFGSRCHRKRTRFTKMRSKLINTKDKQTENIFLKQNI